MGRIAVTEDVEGLRDEENFGDEVADNAVHQDEIRDSSQELEEQDPSKSNPTGKCIPTVIEVQDAFDAMNTLRYSQPTHLQGVLFLFLSFLLLIHVRRQVPRLDNHPIQCWPLTWWHNMEDSFTVVWHHHLCSQHQPYEGTTLGRDCPYSTSCWWNLRTLSPTRPPHYRCRSCTSYYQQKERS